MIGEPSDTTAKKFAASASKKEKRFKDPSAPDHQDLTNSPILIHHRHKQKRATWETWVADALHGGISPKLLFWSVIDGIVAGFVVAGFRWVIEELFDPLLKLYDYIREGHWWVITIVVAVSICLSFFIAALVRSEPLSSRSGAADVEARLHSSHPSWWGWWRLLWRKFIGGVLAFAPGLFLGREGPSIQLGATVGLGLTYLDEETKGDRRELVAAGAAAGLAAAFTAPIAATLFLVEGDYLNKGEFKYSLRTIAASFIASVSASIVTVQMVGWEPDFSLPRPVDLPITLYWQLIPVGILCGILAWIYESTLAWGVNIYDKLHIPQNWRAFVPFVMVIPIGIYLPFTLGDGSLIVLRLAHTAQYSIIALFGLVVLRLIFAQISYGSGVPGGIFLPICALGAVFGIFCGRVFAFLNLGPHTLHYYSLFAIVCMSGLFGATVKRPLTAVVLVIEVTSYSNLMVTGVVTIIAYIIANMCDRLSSYRAMRRDEQRIENLSKDAKDHQEETFKMTIKDDDQCDNVNKTEHVQQNLQFSEEIRNKDSDSSLQQS